MRSFLSQKEGERERETEREIDKEIRRESERAWVMCMLCLEAWPHRNGFIFIMICKTGFWEPG